MSEKGKVHNVCLLTIKTNGPKNNLHPDCHIESFKGDVYFYIGQHLCTAARTLCILIYGVFPIAV